MSKIDELKKEATKLGIPFSPNIGEATLSERIATAKAAAPTPDKPEESEQSEIPDTPEEEVVEKEETEAEYRQRKIKEANRLVRVRVTNMNPLKKAITGEIISAGNSVIGTVKKYILFDKPYHVPEILLGVMKDIQFRQSKTVKVGGKTVKRNIFIKEYAIEYLDPLTPSELKKIADRQSIDKELEE